MANEIQFSAAFQVNNPSSGSGYSSTKQINSQLTQNAVGVFSELPLVPTTAAGTAYTFTGLATTGWAFLQNLDATNYVEFGVQVAGTFYPVIMLKAGESSIIRLSQSLALYGRANTAAVKALIEVWND